MVSSRRGEGLIFPKARARTAVWLSRRLSGPRPERGSLSPRSLAQCCSEAASARRRALRCARACRLTRAWRSPGGLGDGRDGGGGGRAGEPRGGWRARRAAGAWRAAWRATAPVQRVSSCGGSLGVRADSFAFASRLWPCLRRSWALSPSSASPAAAWRTFSCCASTRRGAAWLALRSWRTHTPTHSHRSW